MIGCAPVPRRFAIDGKEGTFLLCWAFVAVSGWLLYIYADVSVPRLAEYFLIPDDRTFSSSPVITSLHPPRERFASALGGRTAATQARLSPRWPMQPRCLRPGALPPPPTRLSPRYAIRTPSPRSCTLPHKLTSRCPCYCTYTVPASLGAVCGTSSLKARPARRLWSCTLAARSRRSPSSSASSLRRRPLAGPPSESRVQSLLEPKN